MSMIGKTLGTFECTALLGKGGMGEVYKAKDQKLGRDVAIKVLPEEFAKDTDRVARFQREAKLLASLNHPNIAAIHGLEESEGIHFLVLELIEGDTLADRLKRGAIPIEEALKLALQISEALEAAHDKGVIHRDLKPANIKVTPDGKVKVLDFGLAKAFAGDQGEANLSNSPTLSVAATQQGVVLGTAAYMSPEQARGKTVDKRTDIWAFGVVLYEMLTGQSAFQGEDVSVTLASVINGNANLNLLPPSIHPRVREVITRCLQKDQKKRYGGIGEALYEIEQVLADPSGVFAQTATTTKPRREMRLSLPWVAAAIALVAVIIGAAVWVLKPSEPKRVIRFDYDLPEGQQFGNLVEHALAASPDGEQIVYATNTGLYLRKMNESEAILIPETDGSSVQPFFSPDGQWLGYFSLFDQKLRKVALSGGAPVVLCDTGADIDGASWDLVDTIVYALMGKGIMRVSANGGIPEVMVKAENEQFVSPQLLPDGKSVLFSQVTSQPYKVMVQSLESGERKELIQGADARYLPTGHLVYAVENILFAVSFDPDRLEPAGGPISIVEGIFRSEGAAQYAVSDSGTLVYVPGSISTQSQLAWHDRKGNQMGLVGEPASYEQFSLSPDEKRVVIERISSGNYSLWILELDRGGVGSPITFDPYDERDPIWSPDGRSIAFTSMRSDSQNLYRKFLAAEEEPELLMESKQGDLHTEDWSDDGRFIAYLEESNNRNAIGILPLLDDQTPIPVFQGKFDYDEPKFSPNGKWMAYISNETGQNEVYIRPLEGEGEKKRISTGGGGQPQWRGDGKELFYLALDGFMMAVEIKGEQFTPGNPEFLFKTDVIVVPHLDQYAVTGNGQRFLILTTGQAGDVSSISIVLNWFEELKERVPVP